MATEVTQDVTQAVQVQLYPGMTLEVLTLENRLIFLGKIEKYNGKMVQVVDGVGREVPPVLFSTMVKLRGFLPGLRPFELRGKVCGSTRRFWRLDDLEGQPMHDRFYFRQAISIPAVVMEVPAGGTAEDALPETAEPCRLLDISCGGLSFQCRRPYDEGQILYLGQVPLLREEHFDFLCFVRNGRQDGYRFRYGCELAEMDVKEQDRLLAAILQVQREAIQARRGEEIEG